MKDKTSISHDEVMVKKLRQRPRLRRNTARPLTNSNTPI